MKMMNTITNAQYKLILEQVEAHVYTSIYIES